MLWECFIKSCSGSKPLSIEKWDNYMSWLILRVNLGPTLNHFIRITTVSEQYYALNEPNIPGPVVPALILNDHYRQCKWNSKLEPQLTFWLTQGSRGQIRGAGKVVGGGGKAPLSLSSEDAELNMWAWDSHKGPHLHPTFTLNTCLKPDVSGGLTTTRSF